MYEGIYGTYQDRREIQVNVADSVTDKTPAHFAATKEGVQVEASKLDI